MGNPERVLDQFYPDGASVNLQFMKINETDLLDFLLCALRKMAPGKGNVRLDDEEYIIRVTFKDKEETVSLDVFLTRLDEKVLAIEFRKARGNTMSYHKKIAKIKGQLKLLQKSEDDQKSG